MTNYSSSGPQVPFGDGSHVPLEEVLEGDVLTETNLMQIAMKDIFLSCDTDNTGSVPASKLIEFVTPFMQQNNTELLELKKSLDPHNSNPHVNKETFFKVMTDWTSRVKGEAATNSVLGERDGIDEKDPSVQFTSKSNFGQYILKGRAESSIQNVSNSSSYSCEGNSVSDLTILQEQINELEHHNRKLTEELTHVRLQLSSCEEQNDVLQTDVEKLSRKLVSEQQLNSQLQLKKTDSDDLLENSAAVQKQIGKLEKLLATAEKENVQLKQNIESMEAEKQKLEDNIEQLAKREEESKKLLLELQSDLDCKDHVITSLEEGNAQLKDKVNEDQQIIIHYTDVNERLKAEKVKLEHYLRERLMPSSLSNQSKSPSNTFSEYTTPNASGTFQHCSILHGRKQSINSPEYTTPLRKPSLPHSPLHKPSLPYSPCEKLIRSVHNFNSPKLLATLANPVSPIISSSRQGRKSVDSDDSPLFASGRPITNSVLTNTASTPQHQKFIQKRLLDETLPSVAHKLPLLEPSRENMSSEPQNHDLRFFSQYRLVGNSCEDDVQDQLHMPAKHISCGIVKQEYDGNLNLILHTETPRNTPPLLSTESINKEGSLPTMYVVDRSGGTSCDKSPSSNSPRSSVLDSSEDEMYWKMQLMNITSPHDSLEQEMVQAQTGCNQNEYKKHLVNRLKSHIQHLETKNKEYEVTIKQLIKDVNLLHDQNSKNEKQVDQCEEKYKDLVVKFKELEGDNSSKYIKIVDLMEQIENLQKQLSGGNDNLTQLNSLKEEVSELQHEKEDLQQQLQQWEKQNSETLMQHLQSMKTECELLRSRLDLSTEAEQKISKEFEKICCENNELRKQLEFLRETIHELNSEKSKLTNSIHKLTEEYNAGKAEIKANNAKETEITGRLTKLVNENLELKETLANGDSTRTESQVEEVESLRQVVKQHTATIEKLSQSAEEKKHQISMLKKMVNYQNTNLKSLEQSKVKNADELYEQKCANDKLIDENKALLVKLHCNEKEKKHLQCELLTLGDSNKSIQAELENIRCDNKKMKDAHSIIGEYQLLMEEKALLIRQREELTKENNKLEEMNKDLQQQMRQLQQGRDDLLSNITVLNSKLHSADTDITKLAEMLQELKVSSDQATNDLIEKIGRLENTSKSLHSENKKLQSKFAAVKKNYEALVNEKEEWIAEQNNWEQMKEEFRNNLTSAKTEASRLQKRLNEIEADAKSSQENLADDEVLCENCIMLKLEVEELTAHIDHLNCEVVTLEAEERSSKKGNFEKMQLQIEKLKSKVERTEELLGNEKLKVELLEDSNLRLKEQTNENLKRYEEQAVIFAEKVTLEGRFNEVIEELKRVQNEKQELEQEKHHVSRNSVNLEKKLRDAARLMEERLELMNKENVQLQEEVTDLRNRKTSLEKKVDKLQCDLKAKADFDNEAEVQTKTKEGLLDSVNKENVQLQQEITDLHNQKINLEKQLDKLQNELKEKIDTEEKFQTAAKIKEDLLDSINKECVQLQRELENTHNQKIGLEKKLERTQNDLQKSEAKNLSIRKMLTDVQSSVYEKCNDALQKNVEGLLKERDSQVNILQKQLKDYEEELMDIKLKLSESSDSLNLLSEHVGTVNRNLAERRQELNRCALAVLGNWRSVLESTSDVNSILEALTNCELVDSFEIFTGPLDVEMNKLKHQIKLIAQLLDALSAIKIPPDGEKLTFEKTQSPLINPRFVKKIILKTTTTEIRHISSDGSLAKTTQADGIPENTGEAMKVNDVDVNSSQQKSQNQNSFKADALKVERGFGHNTALELVSPGLSDSVMGSLGLLDSDGSSEVKQMDMEEKYGILAAAFMINISTIRDRYQQQQCQQIDIENQFSIESEKLVTTLTSLQDLDKDRHLDRHITTCLHQVNTIVGMFAQTSVLAMQYGALLHEQRLLKCVNLMINYTAHLRQVVEKATLQLKYIRSTSLSPNPRRKISLASSNRNLSVPSNESFEHNGVDCSALTNTNVGNNVDIPALHAAEKMPHRFQHCCQRMINSLVNHNVRVASEWFWLAMIFLIGGVIAAFIIKTDCSNAACSTTYPWHWVSWNDIFAPYIKRTYPNGPPPI